MKPNNHSSILLAAAATLAFGATLNVQARSITGISYTQSASGEKRVSVAFEAGAAGDDHALYLAFDDADKGADPSAWASFQRVGRIAADATSASAVVSSLAAGSHSYCRAFLVENALPYDTLVETLRQTGTQWLDTGVKPGPTTAVTLTAKLDEVNTKQQYLFGVGSSDGTSLLAFEVYIQGGGHWAANCRDGSGDWQTADTGWNASAAGYVMHTVDATTGNYTFKQLYNGNGMTHTKQAGHTRTATAAGTLTLFARKSFASGADAISAANIVRGGLIESMQIRNGGASGTLVRDFHPCSVNARGAMFDTVTGGVSFSGGSEPFLAGGEALAAAPATGETMLSASAAVSLASPGAPRAFAGFDYRVLNGITNIVATLPAAVGSAHALYLAWDAEDKGDALSSWAHFQRVGRVTDNAATITVACSSNLLAQGFTVCRGFLVEDALPYDYEVPLLRQNRKQWINTGVHAGPGTRTEMTFQMDNDTITEQRPFGVDSGNAAVGFSYAVYANDVGSNGQRWYTCCQDGVGNYLNQGWSLPTTQFQTISLDANDGLAAGYLFSVTNHTTGGNSRFTYTGTSRTATSTWPIALFARTTRDYVAGTDTMAVDHFLEGATIQSCRIWEREGLVRDFVPVSVGGEGGFYDRVTGEVYLSATTSGVPCIYYGSSGSTVPTEEAPLVAYGDPVDCVPVAGEELVAVSRACDITVPHGTVVSIR